MQANPKTIDQLFNAQTRYVVPMFQRLYVWSENPQWQTLWEDVAEKADLELSGVANNAHYLGALIIEGVKPSSPREVKRFLVIDGQQRLTTIQLLLCAFRDLARERDWKSLDKSISRYIENADPEVMESPDEEVFKLWPTQLNRDIFSQIIRAGSRSEVEKKFPQIKLPRRRKPEPRSNLVEAYLYFYRRIEEWLAAQAIEMEDAAFKLLLAIKQDFCVVEISLSDGDDSQEIFYSLNSQGRPLSQSDLLRSLIFMRAEKERTDRDALFRDFWSAFETEFWSTEIRRAGRNYSRLDLALRYFLTVKTGTLVDARRVNEDYKRWIESSPPRYQSVRAELEDFSRYGNEYRRFELVTGEDLRCDRIERIVRDFDVSTALPLVLFLRLEANLAEMDLQRCLDMVQSYIVRRAFRGEETKEYNKLFVELVGALKDLKGPEVPAVLEKRLLAGKGTTRVWPTDNDVIEAARSRGIYNALRQPALRVILERLELSQRGKKSENEPIPSGLQIEHIMPQAWFKHWPIGTEVVEENTVRFSFMAAENQKHLVAPAQERNRVLQTLGNLTLLNQYLNPAAGNGSFALKKIEYANSVLRLNRYFDLISTWDEDTITNRGTELGKLMCQIWPRPPGPSSQG